MDLDSIIRSFAKGVSNQIIDEAHSKEKILVRYVCPVYCELEQQRLSHIGSAVLIRIADLRLLATAAHVLDHQVQGTLCIPGNHGLIPINGQFHSTRIPAGKTRDDDKIDIGICRLDEQTVNSILSHSFLSTDDIIPDDKPAFAKLYSFVGYPNTKNKVRYSVKPAPYSFLNTPLSIDLYAQYGLERASHIAIKYERKKTITASRKPTTFPDPHGLSGGGLWVWEILDGPKAGNPEVSPKLVGVATGYTRDKRAWFATKIGLFLECARALFPDLDQAIPKPSTTRVNVTLN